MIKKLKMLVLPYFLWGLLGTVIVMPIVLFNNHVNGAPLLSRTFLDYGGLWTRMDHLFGVTVYGPCGNLALWYVRTLIVIFIFAPVWRFCVVKFPVIMALAGLGVVILLPVAIVPIIAIRYASLGWFIIGGCIARLGWTERQFPLWLVIVVGMGWFACAAIQASGIVVSCNVLPLFGVIFCWSLYDVIPSSYLWPGGGGAHPTFWVYCLHGLLMPYICAGVPYALGKNDWTTLGVTLIGPWLGIALCVGCALIVKRYANSVYGVLIGGRG